MKFKLSLKTDLGIDFLCDDGIKRDWIVCLTFSPPHHINRYTKVERLGKYEV